VAKKVGDQYEMVRVDPDEGAASAMWAGVGGGVGFAGSAAAACSANWRCWQGAASFTARLPAATRWTALPVG